MIHSSLLMTKLTIDTRDGIIINGERFDYLRYSGEIIANNIDYYMRDYMNGIVAIDGRKNTIAISIVRGAGHSSLTFDKLGGVEKIAIHIEKENMFVKSKRKRGATEYSVLEARLENIRNWRWIGLAGDHWKDNYQDGTGTRKVLRLMRIKPGLYVL